MLLKDNEKLRLMGFGDKKITGSWAQNLPALLKVTLDFERGVDNSSTGWQVNSQRIKNPTMNRLHWVEVI